MAVREDAARDVQHEPVRHGRHGRPRPFGGRLRLPTLRFSGAAMAMSTVVGISIATTLLLNEQQGVGRRAGVARVGTTPPPTPTPGEQAQAAADQVPAGQNPTDPPATGRPSAPRPAESRAPSQHSGAASSTASGSASPSASGTRSEVPVETGGQAAADRGSGRGPGSWPADTGTPATQADAAAGPSPSAQPGVPATDQPTATPSTSPSPTVPHAPGPRPVGGPTPAPGESTAPSGPSDGTGTGTPAPGADPDVDQALAGVATVTPLGRDGLRHQLDLAAAEPLTALQAEFRLSPGELAPGSGTAWTDLPGAVVTAQQDRGTLVYRFTTPAGTDVPPGRYTFVVRGTRPTAGPSGPSGLVRKPAAVESWSAAAFGIDHPRAVAALGSFGPVAPQPAEPQAPGLPPATAPRTTASQNTAPQNTAPPAIAPR
ncbi:hypothetical protein [Kitasatospora sp. NPDC087314]|uniref:hypothetical protein n=1 Tax=Kitasatospora sp. NPDC087314 TaxID=3364068 RepID=UPI0037FC3499